ncbi:MAG: MarR family transcriptional regulator [Bacteroidales bacterium]|nr:MarR family transcriptional regulator [Bacteroidales bacterium]
MPVNRNQTEVRCPEVRDWETMLELIHEYRIIPFFSNPISGYSIEEHTPSAFWFNEDSLGPWDWKIDCIQNGDIAYGKFLWGGKAAFATTDVYRELANWRRSLPKYAPNPLQQQVLDYLEEHGSVSVPEVRKLLGIKKSAADSLLARLQMQTRVLTGDIARIYRGADLSYSGWQRSTFCSPESLFEDEGFPFPGYRPRSFKSTLTPAESLDFVKEAVRAACGETPDKLLLRMIG